MEKVRIGIVGSKFAADFHCDSYSRNEHAELVAVAAIDNLEAISSKWNIPHSYEKYEEMFERDDIDLVSVCVPNFLHHDVVFAAAKAGKNVVCEKPLATTAEDAGQMIHACEDSGVKLMYAEDWCFAPALKLFVSTARFPAPATAQHPLGGSVPARSDGVVLNFQVCNRAAAMPSFPLVEVRPGMPLGEDLRE